MKKYRKEALACYLKQSVFSYLSLGQSWWKDTGTERSGWKLRKDHWERRQGTKGKVQGATRSPLAGGAQRRVLRKGWRGLVGRRGERAASGHSRLSCRLRIRSLHGLFLIQCSRDGNTMVPKWGSNTSSWLENKSARSDTGSQGQTYKKKNFF